MMAVIGLDIGGANIKVADAAGQTASRPFDLWRTPQQLPDVLADLLQGFAPTRLAVTMTGELADCFPAKQEGVEFILDAVERAACGLPVHVWQTSGDFVAPEQARAQPLQTAAANWHALATWAGRLVDAPSALLVDIGSTTTDLIPLRAGRPHPRGQTDPQRLLSGELVYTGVRRTPVCGLAPTVPFRGEWSPLAAELFATSLDVYLLRGDIPEDPDDCHTANGRPATRDAAHDRLARMLCADRSECSLEDTVRMAEFLAQVQLQQLSHALDRVLQRQESECAAVIVSGSGEFLARRLVHSHPRTRGAALVSISARLSPAVAEAACAYAVAVLGQEAQVAAG